MQERKAIFYDIKFTHFFTVSEWLNYMYRYCDDMDQ